MALTFSETAGMRTVFGDRRVVKGIITFDSSYPLGGEPVTASLFQLKTLDWLEVEPVCGAMGAASRLARWDSTNGTIELYTAISTEAADTSDQSTIVVHVTAYGK